MAGAGQEGRRVRAFLDPVGGDMDQVDPLRIAAPVLDGVVGGESSGR